MEKLLLRKNDINALVKTVILLPLLFAFVGECLLILCSGIPNSLIENNINQGIDIVKNVEGYEPAYVFDYTESSKLDNYTDRQMFEIILNPGGTNIFQKAQVPNYSRYWQGYIIVLKPLFVFLNYSEIRYAYMFAHLICLSLLVVLMAEKISYVSSMSMVISVGAGYFIILPYSLQYSSVFFVMYLASIVLLLVKDISKVSTTSLICFFGVVGCITNFFDFLTVPLITLGIPLAIYTLRCQKQQLKCLSKVIMFSLAWCSYFIMWISKWIIGSFVLHQNIIADAINQASMRISAKDEAGLENYSRIDTIKLNFQDILPKGIGVNKMIIVIIILLSILILFHESKRVIVSLLPLLLIALYPYIWYLIMTNHSHIHHFFTYRNQIISLFCLLTFILQTISFEKIKRTINKNKAID